MQKLFYICEIMPVKLFLINYLLKQLATLT